MEKKKRGNKPGPNLVLKSADEIKALVGNAPILVSIKSLKLTRAGLLEAAIEKEITTS
jgi:hypothetical protein